MFPRRKILKQEYIEGRYGAIPFDLPLLLRSSWSVHSKQKYATIQL